MPIFPVTDTTREDMIGEWSVRYAQGLGANSLNSNKAEQDAESSYRFATSLYDKVY